MWDIPLRIERLFRAIDSRLGAIENALQKQERSIRYAAQRAKNKWREIPGIIASNVLGTAEDKEGAKAQQIKANDQQERLIGSQRKLVFWTRIGCAIAAVAAGGAIYYACVTRRQLATMDRTLCELRKQNGLIQQQVTAQQDNFKITERAWLSLTGTGFDYSKDKGVDRARGTVVLINTGPSPAFHLDGWLCFRVRENEPLVGKEIPKQAGCDRTILGILGTNVPVGFIRVDPTRTVAANSLPENIGEPGERLYVWGRIVYWTFAKGQEHFTSFCLVSNGNQLGPCRKGNDAD